MSLVAFLDNAGRADAADGPPREPDAHAARFHRTIPGYAPSALAKAPAAAERLGLSRLLVKRETERFGPPSFKVLGTSWVCRALSLRAGVPPAASFDALRAMIPRLDGIRSSRRRTETTAVRSPTWHGCWAWARASSCPSTPRGTAG